ncbi:MAG: hypothetical protein LLG40_14030 [Deltaproteobacteria bacterium]|nr:hypothetical protein [Deltaproteobacteria bacterium]
MKATATWRYKLDEKAHEARLKITCLEIASDLAKCVGTNEGTIQLEAENVLDEAKIFHAWLEEK